MKKGLVLATIFALCSTMIVSAKEFNDARWQWFYSNANYTGKVDLNTLSYDPSTDTATAWADGCGPTVTKTLCLMSYTSKITLWMLVNIIFTKMVPMLRLFKMISMAKTT